MKNGSAQRFKDAEEWFSVAFDLQLSDGSFRIICCRLLHPSPVEFDGASFLRLNCAGFITLFLQIQICNLMDTEASIAFTKADNSISEFNPKI